MHLQEKLFSLCDHLFCSDRKWRPMEAPAGSVFFLAMGVGPPSDVWSGFRFYFSRRKWALWAQMAETHLLWKSLQKVMKVELGLHASLQHTCAISREQLQTSRGDEKSFRCFHSKPKAAVLSDQDESAETEYDSKCLWLALNLCYWFVRLATMARPAVAGSGMASF